MKKHTKSFASALLCLVLISALSVNAYSQRDPNEYAGNSDKPLRLIMPSIMPLPEYQSDYVVQIGSFDMTQVSTNAGFAETDICVNPANPLNFVASDNRVTGFSGGRYVYYTTDGGITWGSPTLPSANQGDPAFACDAAGNFYLMTLNSAVTGFVLYKSVNGGATWTQFAAFNPGGGITAIDKEWIWADQTTGTYQNNVYMGFVNFTSSGVVAFMRSTNNGSTWTLVSGNLGTATANPGPDVCTDNTGRVFLAWDNGGGASMRVSTDGGATFGSTVTVSQASQPGSFNSVSGRYVLKNNIRVNGMPHIACDVTNGPNSGNVYCIYATNPPGADKADVYLTRSTDHGATWNNGTPVRVNDDVFGTVIDQWMCDVSVDNAGRVWGMWWDSRNDQANNILTETWAACSTDGGQTFMPNFPASNENFNPNSIAISQGTQHNYLGDYQGISGKSVTFPFYVGPGTSLNDFTNYLPDYGISFAKSVDSVNPNGMNTNILNIPMNGPFSGAVTISQTVTPPPSTGTLTFNWAGGNTVNLNGTPTQVGLTVIASTGVPLGTYDVAVTLAQNGGPRTHTRHFTVLVGNFTGISNNGTTIPEAYQLYQNYPNPFNPTTVIYFAIPKTLGVTLKVYDIMGREVKTLINNQVMIAGDHSIHFDATNLPSGIYYYRMNAGDFSDVRKMIVLK